MRINRFRAVTANFAVLICLCSAGGANAQPSEQAERACNAEGALANCGAAPTTEQFCSKVLTVDSPPLGTTHLGVGHRLLVQGPFEHNNFVVRPLRGAAAHEWQPDWYDALNISSDPHPAPQRFLLSVSVAGTKHPTPDTHPYEMRILRFDPEDSWCADEAEFVTGYDPDVTGDDHGGTAHANAD